jgi:dephospho-CoA kinase
MIRGRFVIGLTGSIGMGKSFAASCLRKEGVPVFDADAEVHLLMAKGGRAVRAVEAAFPGVAVNGSIDRTKLGPLVFGNHEALSKLEKILHPMVGEEERSFIARAARSGHKVVARDVPLLFETGGDKRCDITLVVSAPAHIQRARVLARPGMTEERLSQVLAKQLPDAEKRRKADIIIPSGLGKRLTRDRIRQALRGIRQKGKDYGR